MLCGVLICAEKKVLSLSSTGHACTLTRTRIPHGIFIPGCELTLVHINLAAETGFSQSLETIYRYFNASHVTISVDKATAINTFAAYFIYQYCF